MTGARRIGVVIVGAGLGGIAAAIELRRHGFDDVTVLERGHGLGGTWQHNTYPGCAWRRPKPPVLVLVRNAARLAAPVLPAGRVLRYLEEVAREHGVDRLIRFGVDVTSCRWDPGTLGWTVSSRDGRRWEADALILATGQLHQPAIPAIDGASSFQGRPFHSACWDHSYSLPASGQPALPAGDQGRTSLRAGRAGVPALVRVLLCRSR